MDIDDDMEWDNCEYDCDGDCFMGDETEPMDVDFESYQSNDGDMPMEGSDYLVLRSLKTGQLYCQFFNEIDEDL